MNNNKAVRESAKEKRVKLWQVAERFGKSDSAFTRQMRHELSPEDTEKALQFIDEIAAETEQ